MIVLGNKFDGNNYEIEDVKTSSIKLASLDNIANIL